MSLNKLNQALVPRKCLGKLKKNTQNKHLNMVLDNVLIGIDNDDYVNDKCWHNTTSAWTASQNDVEQQSRSPLQRL